MPLTTLTTLLPSSWRPYAKAVWPAIAAVLAAVIHGIVTGTVRTLELEVAVVGLLAAFASLVTTNAPVGVRRYAKALVPALLTIAGVLVHAAVTGDFDEAQWTLAITGLGASLVSLLVPNLATPMAPSAFVVADAPEDRPAVDLGDPEDLHEEAAATDLILPTREQHANLGDGSPR